VTGKGKKERRGKGRQATGKLAKGNKGEKKIHTCGEGRLLRG